ncbi:hypothetical protein P7K49_026904 [Saguinus oedipus]|uniref:Uncharacterized protein n=1 Tax=Saguinus oedipus TaxID=9490 RepID=A0ABQ9UEH8_SAGOE|nr:hypothetical protein P7K49_026904 [Saguinus oedipus]
MSSNLLVGDLEQKVGKIYLNTRPSQEDVPGHENERPTAKKKPTPPPSLPPPPVLGWKEEKSYRRMLVGLSQVLVKAKSGRQESESTGDVEELANNGINAADGAEEGG